ncbi:MAG: class I SAM-dependent RNA methyltransferase [Anaerolineales bacterium]
METITLTLTSLAHSGDALGRLPDGRACFVPFGMPGEVVRVRVVDEKKRFARAALLEILAPADERIEPRCTHFTECGGCHFQHIPYEAQLKVKTTQLRETLQRLAGLDDPLTRPIVPSPNPWNYRNYVQFHITPDGEPGFRAPRSRVIVPIRECYLPEPTLNERWPLLDLEPIPGLKRVGLRAGRGGDVQLTFESTELTPPEFHVDFPISAVHLGPNGSSNPIVLSGSGHITIEVLGRPFRVSAGTFFQVNTAAAAKMVAHILDHLPQKLGTVLDLYCGGGLFSAFLAPRAERLIGVETHSLACDDFAFNLDEYDHVELYQGLVEDLLPYMEVEPDLILADPPRPGLGRRTLDAILSLSPPTLVYVSCNPGVLARDAKTLIEGGYSLAHVTPFDLFPHTYHLESISFWTRG